MRLRRVLHSRAYHSDSCTRFLSISAWPISEQARSAASHEAATSRGGGEPLNAKAAATSLGEPTTTGIALGHIQVRGGWMDGWMDLYMCMYELSVSSIASEYPHATASYTLMTSMLALPRPASTKRLLWYALMMSCGCTRREAL